MLFFRSSSCHALIRGRRQISPHECKEEKWALVGFIANSFEIQWDASSTESPDVAFISSKTPRGGRFAPNYDWRIQTCGMCVCEFWQTAFVYPLLPNNRTFQRNSPSYFFVCIFNVNSITSHWYEKRTQFWQILLGNSMLLLPIEFVQFHSLGACFDQYDKSNFMSGLSYFMSGFF